jgi:hypothetical protein
LCGFAAAARLHLRLVLGAPVQLYVERLSSEVLRELELVPAERGAKVDVHVRQPRWPTAVFKASVLRDRAPVADVIQCWLDVVDHPARGKEQADLIREELFVPHLFGGSRP